MRTALVALLVIAGPAVPLAGGMQASRTTTKGKQVRPASTPESRNQEVDDPLETPEPSTPDQRYLDERFPMEFPEEFLGGLPPGWEEVLQMFGTWERAEAGDSVELLALQAGRDPEIVRRLNAVESGHMFEKGQLVCLDRTHRRAPDESMEFLAGLYATDVETLRALNGLRASEEPPAWSKVTVPLRYEEKAVPDGTTLRMLKVHLRGHDEEFMNAWLDLDTLKLREHRVVEGETWESVAGAHQTTAHRLKMACLVRAQIHGWGNNPFEESTEDLSPLAVGESVAVGSSVEVREGRPPVDLALILDYLSGDLDQLLALNELDEPEQLAAQRKILLPLSVMSLRLGVNVDEEGFALDDVEDRIRAAVDDAQTDDDERDRAPEVTVPGSWPELQGRPAAALLVCSTARKSCVQTRRCESLTSSALRKAESPAAWQSPRSSAPTHPRKPRLHTRPRGRSGPKTEKNRRNHRRTTRVLHLRGGRGEELARTPPVPNTAAPPARRRP